MFKHTRTLIKKGSYANQSFKHTSVQLTITLRPTNNLYVRNVQSSVHNKMFTYYY